VIQASIQEAYSCSVPVFRYALERWRPDPYKGVYIYRGEIGREDQALLKGLEDASANADSPLNLIIRKVDADSFSEEKLTEILQGPVPDELPVLNIWYPGQMGKGPPLWSEKLAPSLVKNLVQSSKRKEVAESLINGDSVVWVFMPSGDTEKDENAKAFIRHELDKAEQQYAETPFTILSGAKRETLSSGFPIVTLLRDDPAERIFVDTLMKSEPDLYEHMEEPMVFPIFGRGRALGCLFGDYITEKNIREATAFLSGACSCEVKELNPGVDLLMAAPWDMVVMISFIEDTPLPELTGVMPEPLETAGMEESLHEEVIHPDSDPNLFTIYGITLLFFILAAGISGFIINRRRQDK
jgi:hypothetical protein